MAGLSEVCEGLTSTYGYHSGAALPRRQVHKVDGHSYWVESMGIEAQVCSVMLQTSPEIDVGIIAGDCYILLVISLFSEFTPRSSVNPPDLCPEWDSHLILVCRELIPWSPLMSKGRSEYHLRRTTTLGGRHQIQASRDGYRFGTVPERFCLPSGPILPGIMSVGR